MDQPETIELRELKPKTNIKIKIENLKEMNLGQKKKQNHRVKAITIIKNELK